MASTKLFEVSPAFPNDVATADMIKISLTNLSKGDDREAEALFKACGGLGFFLLDLNGDTAGEQMIREIDTAFEVARTAHGLDDAEKKDYAQNPPTQLFGQVLLCSCPIT